MTAPGTRLLVAVSADTVIDTDALAASEPVAAMGAGDRTYWVTGVAAKAVDGNAAVISRPARPQPIVLAMWPIAAVMTQSPVRFGYWYGPSPVVSHVTATERHVLTTWVEPYTPFMCSHLQGVFRAQNESSREVVPVSYTHLRAHETVLDLVC